MVCVVGWRWLSLLVGQESDGHLPACSPHRCPLRPLLPSRCRHMTDAGPLDQIKDEDSDDDDLLPPTLAGGAAGESDLPGTGACRQPAGL